MDAPPDLPKPPPALNYLTGACDWCGANPQSSLPDHRKHTAKCGDEWRKIILSY